MKLIMFKGRSKTGKTATVENVIKELCNRGYSVGSIKNIHFEAFTMEREGTDTDRHKKAGANPVTARGLKETNISFNESMHIEDILKNYDNDYVVLEGNSGANCPMIITGSSFEDLDVSMTDETVAFAGVISESAKEYKGLPIFNGLKSPKELVDFIENLY